LRHEAATTRADLDQHRDFAWREIATWQHGQAGLDKLVPEPVAERGRPASLDDRRAMLTMLVALREEAGLNQTALAARLGITQSEISKFERGERSIDVLRLRSWVQVLGMDFAAFVAALDRALEHCAR
jgi:hypothetical protein